MSDDVTHKDNDTPDATDDDIKRVDQDTPQNANPGASVDEGAGASPADPEDTDENADPKSGHSPV